MRAFILCAGQKTHVGKTNKCLLEIGGETLLDRTLRLTKGTERVIVGYDSILKRPRIKMINPEANRCMVESLYSMRNAWCDFNIVLLGDVYYSDEAASMIMESARSEDIVFYRKWYGRKTSMLAMSFPDHKISDILESSEEAMQQFIINGEGGKLGDIGIALDEMASPIKVEALDDKTRDFDTEKHVAEWLEKYGSSS